ncbi:MAG: hypothetical protein ACXWNX_10695 [Isosphaeraceae bacterium]
MDNLLTVAFEAHNPEKNHHCRYQVTVGRDRSTTGRSPSVTAAPARPAASCATYRLPGEVMAGFFRAT